MTFIPRPITLDPDPLLRQKALPLALPLSPEHQSLIEYMIDHVRISQDDEQNKEWQLQGAVGIAAPQLGYSVRMFVMRAQDDKGRLQEYAFINPKLLGTSVQRAYLKNGEGCLSIPTVHSGYVPRYARAIIKGFDYIQQKEVQVTFVGYPAIVAQHEFDHLEGILYYDRINKDDPYQEIANAIIYE